MREPNRMSVAEWVKELRARLGISSQQAFAETLKLSDRSTVAKWESGVQNPGVASWRRLWTLAPPDLRACAPDVVAGLGVADRSVTLSDTMPKGYEAKTKEAATIAEEIDSIEEPILRRRARNAALRCIEETLRAPPPTTPTKGEKPET